MQVSAKSIFWLDFGGYKFFHETWHKSGFGIKIVSQPLADENLLWKNTDKSVICVIKSKPIYSFIFDEVLVRLLNLELLQGFSAYIDRSRLHDFGSGKT